MKNSMNNSENTSVVPNNEPENKNSAGKKNVLIIISIVLIVAFSLASVILFNGLLEAGASALAEQYKSAYEEKKNSTYEEKYEIYKNRAEREYHVSNRVAIYVENLREEQKLEVLKVRDVEFSIIDKEDNEGNVVSWLEVPGEGTFVVDLKAGEYIVDNEHAYVLVRVPQPELTNVKIDYGNVTKVNFKDDLFNGSFREGEELARQQLVEGDLLIRKEFTSNQYIYKNAQNAARKMIEALVKQLNPNVNNLMVDVEFY